MTVPATLQALRGQVRRLSQDGWKTSVAAAPAPAEALASFTCAEQAHAFPVPMAREISPLEDLRSLWRMTFTLRQAKPLITNVGTPKAGLIGGLAAAITSVPVRVYTLHGLRLETTLGAKRHLLTATERLAMACAHHIVCVSPSLRRRVIELGLAPAHKLIVLGEGSPNGVPLPDLEQLSPFSDQLRRRLELPEGTPVIGFVGRFVRDKGIEELLRAFEVVQAVRPDTRLLLIGDHEEGDPLPPKTRRELDSLPGILRTGFIPDVTTYYPLMTVLALPTYREGFPTVALEAAAAGIPVVTTEATGAFDAVQDGQTGWRVPVGDQAALACALLEAIQNPQEALRRGQAGRQWAARHFAPEVVQGRWIGFYEDLLRHNVNRTKREPGLSDFLPLVIIFAVVTLGLRSCIWQR